MSPWQIAQYPIAFCVTVIIVCITISFLSILLKKTRDAIDDDHDDETDEDDDEFGCDDDCDCMACRIEKGMINGHWFSPITTEDAFRMNDDGEYPELFIKTSKKIIERQK